MIDEGMRNKMIAKGVSKVMGVAHRMEKSRDLSYTKATIKITNELEIEINAIRDDESTDEKLRGRIYEWEIYAIVNGKDVDGETVSSWNDLTPSVYYMLNCYI